MIVRPRGEYFFARQVVGGSFVLDLAVRLITNQSSIRDAIYNRTLLHPVIYQVVARKDVMILKILELNTLSATPVPSTAKSQEAEDAAVYGAGLATGSS